MAPFEEVVLGRQLDAVTRVLGLFTDQSLTASDVFNVLAQAETDAQYLCGFVDLNQYDDEKRVIIEHAINRKLVTIDTDKHLSLTLEGRERAKKELPEPIEESIRNR
ncbi:MAG: hypothetical protein A3J47_03115 [Candidatus Yanofskybacteria bacterium RIFCSPHIGHO2_02_FULL_43_22]|uniref:Uncharacterized protein n=1 Tax=Candidatus Yanofskybacteria bacterium RIFCSPHIGHO2_02_FULL_43_22 TaxID=1802681 RepID=A0A1F8FMQ8_9BACT|nr:MAG: hypothetical protein A3J47_03115 [Candidatus Yanofskybacteria bacterium RIFCSPHIGHO2_02_FULL_43_22]